MIKDEILDRCSIGGSGLSPIGIIPGLLPGLRFGLSVIVVAQSWLLYGRIVHSSSA